MSFTIQIPYRQSLLNAVRHTHTSAYFKACILYYHGGGLLYGVSEDLPGYCLDKLLSSGYDLITFEYLLSPETKLDGIHDSVFSTLEYFYKHPVVFGYENMPPYFLFGRSAGAYLALYTAFRCKTEHSLPVPLGVISFYGYYSFLVPEFQKPAALYLTYPPVPESLVNSLTAGSPVSSGPVQERCCLYIYARQTGSWTSMLGSVDILAKYSLTDEQLEQLPPCFFTASSTDPDVPFRISKHMSKTIPGSTLKPVYFLPHDFDRDVSNPAGLQIYEEAVSWCDSLYDQKKADRKSNDF
jgi:acetyl esterase